MKHDCIELLECKHFPTNSIDEYEDCINRKAAIGRQCRWNRNDARRFLCSNERS